MNAFDPKNIADIAAEVDREEKSEAELRGGEALAVYMPPRRSSTLGPIEVVKGEIDVIVSQAQAALMDAAMPVFSRDKILVRPASRNLPGRGGRTVIGPTMVEMSTSTMIEWLNYVTPWEKYDGRSKSMVACDPPEAVAKALLARTAMWRLSPIAGVIVTPTIRADGSIFSAPGYDHATHLFHLVDPTLRMRVKEMPTRTDALVGLQSLKDLLAGFPFVSELDRSVAISAMITCVSRGAIPAAPMTATRASTAGTGKSFLIDVFSVVSTGRECPVISVAQKEEETEKRLTGMLLNGSPIFSIDNVNGELGGDQLCQAVERPLVSVRPLGTTDMFEIESRATIFASGNNLIIRDDMVRRTLLTNLDANVERPEERAFDFNPVDLVVADRGLYVSACLTIVRAYMVAGQPGKLRALASFEAWSDMVRSAMVWLEMPDPCQSMEAARAEDPVSGKIRAVVEAWKAELFVTQAYATRELMDEAGKKGDVEGSDEVRLLHPLLADALQDVGSRNGRLDSETLGKWLRSTKGRIVGGFKLINVATGNKPALWKLVDVAKPAGAPTASDQDEFGL